MMRSKLIKIAISFILIILSELVLSFWGLGIQNPHVGLLYVLGLLFGAYGALGAVSANIILDLSRGYAPIEILPSAIISFGVSYLAYKLWYSGLKANKITKPRLNSTYNLILFLSSIIICGFIYSVFHGHLIGLFLTIELNEYVFVSYFLNFINIAFILGILGIWISEKIDFIETPKKSEKRVYEKLYRALFYLLLIVSVVSLISLLTDPNRNIVIGELTLIGILLFGYLTKPFKYEILPNDKNTITEGMIRTFLIITLAIATLGLVITILDYDFLTQVNTIKYLSLMPALIVTDVIIILFFIPGILILKYVENKVIEPISSFSEIENFIRENEKIESDGLLEVYSRYINEKNEIGTLARSYSELIEHNNNYIENIRRIEGEKERINAELDIATRIQASALPTKAIETDYFTVDGYCHPAKEVGGDFFDYYLIDEENLAIVIGDASGKGVPAALVAMITQVTIKQMLKYDKDPSKVLYLLNNQLAENNPESMFLTLWLGVYNTTTKKLTFSNAGHQPPLIKENGQFKYLDVDAGIVLGLAENFEYISEEIYLTNELVLYTDGITDANNEEENMYGSDRLLSFFNEFESDSDPIMPLLNDIHDFTKDSEQYDDMTLTYLKIK